jgi:NAD(P)-dependent dehydrogenase (short-subunit alcohol dehydrogenase family)
MEFSGKTAFVTGAANGIGLGICRALARNGVNIVLADIEQAQLEIARRELSTFNVRTRAIEVDVSDTGAFERAADEAEAEFGNIHLLFNNAGVSLGAMPLWEVTPAQWECEAMARPDMWSIRRRSAACRSTRNCATAPTP